MPLTSSSSALARRRASSLASAAGLRLDGEAIAVDDHLRTSAPNVYAIGDVASAWNPRYGRSLHLEHWDNAIHQGKAVAANIVGRDVVYDRVPYLYSDQYDVGMEYRGYAHRWDEVVVRGDLAAREFHAFWLRDGRVAAAMNVNLWDDGDDLQALVESGAVVEPRRAVRSAGAARQGGLMRIALTASLVSPIREAEANGPHSVIVDLARGLAARGHEVEIYAAAGSAGRGLAFVEIDVDPRAADAAVRADGIRGRGCARSAAGRIRANVRGAARPPAGRRQPARLRRARDRARGEGLAAVHTLHLPPVDADVVRAVPPDVAAAGDRVGIGRARLVRGRHAPARGDSQRRAVLRTPSSGHAMSRRSPSLPAESARRRERTSPSGLRARPALPVAVVGDIYDRDYYEREVAPLLEPGQTISPLSRAGSDAPDGPRRRRR